MSIDYGLGATNINPQTGIRYGVISQHDVGEAWYVESEPGYCDPDTLEDCKCPTCEVVADDVENPAWGDIIVCTNKDCPDFGEDFEVEFPDFMDPLSHYVEDRDYTAECGDSGDIFVIRSPYYTLCSFCSPCAPGAGYLTSEGDVQAYCFGHDWFEGGKAPYRVYEVKTDKRVLPSGKVVENHPTTT